MNVLKNRVAAFAAVILALCPAVIVAEEQYNPQTVSDDSWDGISFSFYGAIGGGAGFVDRGVFPHVIDASAGIAFFPWLSVGGFTEYSLLSDFDHASLGLSVADEKNSGAIASGTEIILAPWAGNIVHPWVRVRFGGQTLGYLIDADDEEGFESSISSRGFYAAVAAGPELNLTRHTQAFAWGGWHFSANPELAGISKNGMTGFDAGFGVRFTFASTVR